MMGEVSKVSILDRNFHDFGWILFEGSSYVVLCILGVKDGMYLVEPI